MTYYVMHYQKLFELDSEYGWVKQGRGGNWPHHSKGVTEIFLGLMQNKIYQIMKNKEIWQYHITWTLAFNEFISELLAT